MMQLTAPGCSATPAQTATVQRVDVRTINEPIRGEVHAFTVRGLEIGQQSATARRFSSFEQALQAGRALSANAAPGLAVYKVADGAFELRGVTVRNELRESFTDPQTGEHRVLMLGTRRGAFTDASAPSGGYKVSAPLVFDRRLAGVVDGAWALRTVTDARTGVAHLHDAFSSGHSA